MTTIAIIEDEGLVENAARVGERATERLGNLMASCPAASSKARESCGRADFSSPPSRP